MHVYVDSFFLYIIPPFKNRIEEKRSLLHKGVIATFLGTNTVEADTIPGLGDVVPI
jgi:hypothetical protein